MARFAKGSRALAEDGSPSSSFLTPKTYYPGS